MSHFIKKILILILLCYWGNGVYTENDNMSEQLYIITIPESYLNYSQTSAERAATSYIELGEMYCTTAYVMGKDVVIEVNERQRENLIARNNELIKSFIEPFLESNPKYSYSINEDCTELTYYFDENISTMIQLNAVFGVATGYGLNYILENSDPDWEMHIAIYNCHTNKLVVEGNIPTGGFSYGASEWEASYAE